MIQEIKCINNHKVCGSVELAEGEQYKGDLYYGFRCSDCDILTFAENKAERIKQIDSKTSEIISRGFVFEGNTFSLSDNAQRNWIGITAGIAVGLYQEVNFPFPLSDVNDGQYLLTWANRFTFLGQISYTIGLNKTIGTGLKEAVSVAQTQEELDLIIDNRQ